MVSVKIHDTIFTWVITKSYMFEEFNVDKIQISHAAYTIHSYWTNNGGCFDRVCTVIEQGGIRIPRVDGGWKENQTCHGQP